MESDVKGIVKVYPKVLLLLTKSFLSCTLLARLYSIIIAILKRFLHLKNQTTLFPELPTLINDFYTKSQTENGSLTSSCNIVVLCCSDKEKEKHEIPKMEYTSIRNGDSNDQYR